MVKPSRNAVFAEQVVAEVELRLSSGAVKPGERLPSEREFADQLGVNVAGVRMGYHVLRAIGVVETKSDQSTSASRVGSVDIPCAITEL